MGRVFLFFLFIVAAYLLLPMISLAVYYFAMADFYPAYLIGDFVVDAMPGVFLFFWFMNGFITGSRVRRLEILVGLPNIVRLHIWGAYGCTTWVIVHFILKGLPTSVQAWFGLCAAVLFFFLVLSAATQWVDTPASGLLRRLPLINRFVLASRENTQYQYQRRKHNLMAFASILVFLHISLTGMAETSPTFRAISAVYFAWAFFQYIYHKYIRTMVSKRHGLWELQGIQDESDTVTTLVFKEKQLRKPFRYHAGQFGFLRFASGELKGEEHPFSFSSHPDEDSLRFSIQHDGDFTKKLRRKAALGDTAIVDGPYGRFYPDAKQLSKPILFIAGGIGIVPFISLLKQFRRQPPRQPASLLWMNKPERAMFQSDMENFRGIPNLAVQNLSRSAGHPLSLEVLRNVGDIAQREIFVCASKDLTKKVVRMLRASGARKIRIHSELFSM